MITELIRITTFVFTNFLHIWPLLFLTIPLAVFIKEINFSKYLNHILSKNIILSIVIASLVGGLSPFCSCSVIPVISAMLISGVPLAPVMSFWLASPSMDPEIFFLSVASLGWSLAIARIIATLLMSLIGGWLTHQLLKHHWIDPNNILKSSFFINASIDFEQNKKDVMTSSVTIQNSELFQIVSPPKIEKTTASKFIDFKQINFNTFFKDSLNAIWMVMRFLTIAYILEAIIIFYLPDAFITFFLGGSELISIFKATIISIPMYTTNLSALGLVAGFLDKGMTSSAALAFLIGGATTTIPAMSAVYGIAHKRVFTLYVSLAVFGAMISGIVYALIF